MKYACRKCAFTFIAQHILESLWKLFRAINSDREGFVGELLAKLAKKLSWRYNFGILSFPRLRFTR